MELVATNTGAVLQTRTGPLFLLAEFIYDSSDPAAIYLKMQPLQEDGVMPPPTTWVFGRELMDAAMASDRPVGLGDVQISVLEKQNKVRIELLDTEGQNHPVYLELDAVIDFMIAVLQSTPAEVPSFDVDDAIAQILGDSQ